MTEAVTILGMVAVTWGVRMLPFLLTKLSLGPKWLRFLNCVPAAVLAALVAETILMPVSQSGSFIQPEVFAAIICLSLGLFGAPLLVTVSLGMASFWALRYLLV